MKIPKRLKQNPLIEAVAEVRFTSSVPAETIVGLVYGEVRKDYGAPQSLPILQVPSQLRDADAQLRYQSCYRFEGKGHDILLGPRNLALSTHPYVDWSSAEPTLKDLLDKLHNLNLFDVIERIGLRYVNLFENLNILEHTTLKIEFSGAPICNELVNLHFERQETEIKIVTKIANVATVVGPPVKNGSVLDIDVICENLKIAGSETPTQILQLFRQANKHADDTFFRMLKPEFLERFGPEF